MNTWGKIEQSRDEERSDYNSSSIELDQNVFLLNFRLTRKSDDECHPLYLRFGRSVTRHRVDLHRLLTETVCTVWERFYHGNEDADDGQIIVRNLADINTSVTMKRALLAFLNERRSSRRIGFTADRGRIPDPIERFVRRSISGRQAFAGCWTAHSTFGGIWRSDG